MITRLSSLIIIIVLVFSGVVFVWYQVTKTECPVPLTYRLGEIAPEFGVSTSTVLGYLRAAEEPWEETSERDLFVYEDKPSADLMVNFVYDERQETADAEAAERTQLDTEKTKSESVREVLDGLQNQYQNAFDSYQAKVHDYKKRLEEYNATVQKYNDQGGAPTDVYAALETEKQTLQSDADELSVISQQLNDLAGQINQIGEEGNRLVEMYNNGVNSYNNTFGFPREFTQGDYQGDGVINVYKFSDNAEVVTVLAHEFGHALGIDHVAGDNSVMYYLLEHTSATPTLSAADRMAYVAVCGSEQTWQQVVREVIRTFISQF